MGSGSRAAPIALAAALVLAGCGGGSGSSSSTAPSTATAPAPSGEAQKGGEASIEEFGSEAKGSERGAILSSFETYLNAIAQKDYPTACSHLSQTVQGSLEQLASATLKAKGCPATLPKLLAPTAAAFAGSQANGKVTKVRVQGERAFVVFHAPGAKLYQQTMVAEGGEWKMATVVAGVLVPEL